MTGFLLLMSGLATLGARPLSGLFMAILGLALLLATTVAGFITARVPALRDVPGGAGTALGLVAFLAFIGLMATTPPAPAPLPAATAVAQVPPTAVPTGAPTAVPTVAPSIVATLAPTVPPRWRRTLASPGRRGTSPIRMG